MQLSWMRTGLALAVVTAVMLLIPATGIRAEELKLRVDPTADFSPTISDWPAEVVPVYPGAKPFECSPENQPKCGPNPGIYPNQSGLEVSVSYSLIVKGVSGREIEQWYDGQLLANYWSLSQRAKTNSGAVYEKCWDPKGFINVWVTTSPMGEYSGAPILLHLKIEKTKKHPEIVQCGGTVKDNFPGNNTGSSVNSPTGMTELCFLSGEPAKEATTLKSEMQTGFGVNICESDLCGTSLKAPPGFSVTPWSPDGLQAVQSTLNLLNQSCFLKKAGLESVCKSGSQEKEMCSGSSSAYASPTDHKVVLCYDRWGIKDQKKIANEFYGEGTELLQQLLVHEISHVYWRKPDGSLDFDKVGNWLVEAGYLDCTTMLGCLGVAGGGFATPPGGAPTEYAATGPAEDFAESVRFYVTQPDKLLERSPLRYRYLKNDVFCGYEYGTN